MKSSYFIILLLLILVSSCSDDIDVYKTKSGYYASKAGRFVIKFPREPKITTQENKIGEHKFDIISFRYRSGIEQFYGVSYVDYPEKFWKWIGNTEQFFDKTAANLTSEFDGVILYDRQIDTNSKDEQSITYKLKSPPQTMKKRGVIRLIKKGSRFYYIYVVAARRVPSFTELDQFIDSFQTFKPKTEK